MQSTGVYNEDFVHQSENMQSGRLCSIEIVKGTAFAVAKQYLNQGKIGILNFANPHNPGGGVIYGAMAQEEVSAQEQQFVFKSVHVSCQGIVLQI